MPAKSRRRPRPAYPVFVGLEEQSGQGGDGLFLLFRGHGDVGGRQERDGDRRGTFWSSGWFGRRFVVAHRGPSRRHTNRSSWAVTDRGTPRGAGFADLFEGEER